MNKIENREIKLLVVSPEDTDTLAGVGMSLDLMRDTRVRMNAKDLYMHMLWLRKSGKITLERAAAYKEITVKRALLLCDELESAGYIKYGVL